MANRDAITPREWQQLAKLAGYRVHELADKMDVSPRHLERTLRREFGVNPARWLTAQKLQRAAKLLRKYPNIKAVASKLGFKQLSHFSRCFKTYFGISPREFLLKSSNDTQKM
jgi:AraC-like DNA-binding protein